MTPTELLIVAAASLAGSFVKSITGMGYPLIAIPALALVFSVETAIVVIAIPNAILNALLGWDVRDQYAETRDLPVLSATAFLGAIVGTFVLVDAPEEPLRLGLAAIIVVFLIQRWRSPDYALPVALARRFSPLVGLAAGFAHGAVGASGPIVAIWLHAYRLPKNAYVLSVTALFLAGGLSQLGVLLATGTFDEARVVASGVALAATLAAMPFGTRLRARLDTGRFEQVILVLLAVSGVSLVWRSLG